MNAKEYRLKWVTAEESRAWWKDKALRAERKAAAYEETGMKWMRRAEAAEAKLSAAREYVAEANEEFTKAAAEDAAMVEQFNG